MPINEAADSIKRTPQNVFNKSYDEDFDILAVELIGYDSDAAVLRRIKVDGDGKLKVNV